MSDQELNLSPAIVELTNTLQIAENNAPIQESEGDHQQAAYNRNRAASIRQAISILENAGQVRELPISPEIRSDANPDQVVALLNAMGAYANGAGYTGYLSVKTDVTFALAQNLVIEGVEDVIPAVTAVVVGTNALPFALLLAEKLGLSVQFNNVELVQPPVIVS